MHLKEEKVVIIRRGKSTSLAIRRKVNTRLLQLKMPGLVNHLTSFHFPNCLWGAGNVPNLIPIPTVTMPIPQARQAVCMAPLSSL